jgi:hypothetical protein
MMNTFLMVLSGGLAGAFLTLVTQKVSGALRVWYLSKSITAKGEEIPGGCRVRIWNHGKSSIERAIGYISINFDENVDLVDGEELAFIGVHHRKKLEEDRLCWSIASSDPHPYVIDIYQGEAQALDLVRFDDDKIVIPSEQGWDDKQLHRRARVFLHKRRYEGSIHIVAKNTLRRTFDLVIDASSGKQEVTVSERKLKGFIRFFLPWCKVKEHNAKQEKNGSR